MTSCPHCGAELPANAAFCPSCGRRATLPDHGPVDVHHAEPTYFGLGPPLLALTVALALIVLGVVLIVADALAFGVLAVVVGICVFPTFLAGARRWPDHRVSQLGISTADRVRDEGHVAVEAVSTWTRAGREVLRLRKEQHALRRERDARVHELGWSYYREDGRADELRTQAKELDDRIDANERELARTLAEARRRVRKGRRSAASTQAFEAVPSDGQEERATEVAPADGGAADAADTKVEPVDADHRS